MCHCVTLPACVLCLGVLFTYLLFLAFWRPHHCKKVEQKCIMYNNFLFSCFKHRLIHIKEAFCISLDKLFFVSTRGSERGIEGEKTLWIPIQRSCPIWWPSNTGVWMRCHLRYTQINRVHAHFQQRQQRMTTYCRCDVNFCTYVLKAQMMVFRTHVYINLRLLHPFYSIMENTRSAFNPPYLRTAKALSLSL